MSDSAVAWPVASADVAVESPFLTWNGAFLRAGSSSGKGTV